jgi:dTMP kinase
MSVFIRVVPGPDMALFITFEGGEGCGKSFQSRSLYHKLIKRSVPATLVHEPGGTPLGQKIRFILKQASETPISPLAEVLLFNASRAQLVTEVIQPALKADRVVICDRFSDSTLAYQSYGRGLDLSMVKELNQMAAQGLKPDLSFLLDVPPEVGLSRKRVGVNDRFERETLAFHERVRQGFLDLVSEDPLRWVVIDSMLSRSQLAKIIWEKIRSLINLKTED